MKYQVRCFHSKGALLILLWAFLLTMAAWSIIREHATLFQGIQDTWSNALIIALIIVPFACAPLLGWLADAKLGNYRMFKLGNIVCFAMSVPSSICVLILENDGDDGTLSLITSYSAGVFANVIFPLGIISCLITAVKLGLDQMPDASSTNIASFVSWVGFSIAAGIWFCELVYIVLSDCIVEENSDMQSFMRQVFTLLPVICTAVACSLLFVSSETCLLIEPKSPKALKTIYDVLKFAAKHKAPINRSALTYWEEDVPSRLDLGKSRYGGPFTTEQVEDVKTFFKIIVLFIPITVISLSANSAQGSYKLQLRNTSTCTSGIIYSFGYSPWLCCNVITVIYEFVIFSFIRNRLPSILKRIGLTSFFILVSNTVLCILNAVRLTSAFDTDWIYMVNCIIFGTLHLCLITELIEFLCAQSPYNMSGLFVGYGTFLFLASTAVGALIVSLFDNKLVCSGVYCPVIQSGLSSVLSLIGFVSFCLLACWYKNRVRDEKYSHHVYNVVEEVYNRYLTSH